MSNQHPAVTDVLIEALQEALKSEVPLAPWQRPWNTVARTPMNPSSKTRYSGINRLVLSIQPFSDYRWLTFKQVTEAKGRVIKGVKGSRVCYVGVGGGSKEGSSEETRCHCKHHLTTWHYMKTYTVFNIEQTEGCDLPPLVPTPLSPLPVIDRCEQVVERYLTNGGPILSIGADRAAYHPLADTVTVPHISDFISPEHYYGTVYHELGHSTGHSSRLARGLEEPKYRLSEYSVEELIADITAHFLSVHSQIDTVVQPNQYAYIKGWLETCIEQPSILIKASSKASAAADHILGIVKE